MRSTVRNAVVALALLAVPAVAEAQEVQLTGPLAGAPAIKRLVLHRHGRMHLGLVPAFSLSDEYVRHLFVGLRAEYNILDFLAIGVWGGYAPLTFETGLADEVQTKAYSNNTQAGTQNLNFPYGENMQGEPARSNFPDQLGRMQWIGVGQITLIPLRGKLGLVGKVFLDVDVYGFLGVGAVGVQERGDLGRSGTDGHPENNNSPSEVTQSTRVAIAPTFGAGINLYFNKFIGMTLEYRALPFSWNRSGTDECCVDGESFPDDQIDADDRQLSFNQLFSLGVVFALPTTPQVAE
jgi:outer membrane beta-barrel protein